LGVVEVKKLSRRRGCPEVHEAAVEAADEAETVGDEVAAAEPEEPQAEAAAAENAAEDEPENCRLRPRTKPLSSRAGDRGRRHRGQGTRSRGGPSR